jgi:transposase-like protein
MTTAAALVNEALDQLMRRRNIGVAALAEELDIDPATLWRWRQGDLGKAASILIPLVVSEKLQSFEPERVAA